MLSHGAPTRRSDVEHALSLWASRSTTQQRLQRLVDNGLVEVQEMGRRKCYSLANDEPEPVRQDCGCNECFTAVACAGHVDAARLQRYAAKLEHAQLRVGQFSEWHGQPDEKSRVASYKAFQEVAEALMDVAAMAVMDAGSVPVTDRENLDRLVHLGILDDQLRGHLWETDCMRNRLVHEYNGLWDAIDLAAASELVEPLEQAMEVFAKWTSSL